MERVHSLTRASGMQMQWLCGPELLHRAEQAAALIALSSRVRVNVWRVSNWSEMAAQGIAMEQLWLQGRRARVQSHFETLLQTTRGPILAVCSDTRAVAEMLRAFVPPNRRYLSLCGDSDVSVIVRAALRLEHETLCEFVALSPT
jgi:pyruvate dehydrogenase E1 component